MEFLSYDDLVRMRVVRSRETLRRWRKNEGFPEPRTIGRHVVWRAEEVMLWVEQHGSKLGRRADEVEAYVEKVSKGAEQMSPFVKFLKRLTLQEKEIIAQYLLKGGTDEESRAQQREVRRIVEMDDSKERHDAIISLERT